MSSALKSKLDGDRVPSVNAAIALATRSDQKNDKFERAMRAKNKAGARSSADFMQKYKGKAPTATEQLALQKADRDKMSASSSKAGSSSAASKSTAAATTMKGRRSSTGFMNKYDKIEAQNKVAAANAAADDDPSALMYKMKLRSSSKEIVVQPTIAAAAAARTSGAPTLGKKRSSSGASLGGRRPSRSSAGSGSSFRSDALASAVDHMQDDAEEEDEDEDDDELNGSDDEGLARAYSSFPMANKVNPVGAPSQPAAAKHPQRYESRMKRARMGNASK